jgi:hypothetical protein|tara:strand:- start:1009 stop:1203 length:195 start_codon:yes stop_codon:yes gene_type:complete
MITAYGVNIVVYEDEYDREDFELIKGIFDFNDIKLIKISNEAEIASLSEIRKIEIPHDDSFRLG